MLMNKNNFVRDIFAINKTLIKYYCRQNDDDDDEQIVSAETTIPATTQQHHDTDGIPSARDYPVPDVTNNNSQKRSAGSDTTNKSNNFRPFPKVYISIVNF